MLNFLVCQNHNCNNFGCGFSRLFFKPCSTTFWYLYLHRWSSRTRPSFLLLEGHCDWWGVGMTRPSVSSTPVQPSSRYMWGDACDQVSLVSSWPELLFRKTDLHRVSGQGWLGKTDVHLTWWEMGCSCGTQCLDVLYPVFKINRSSLPFRSTSFSHFHDTECQMFFKWASKQLSIMK